MTENPPQTTPNPDAPPTSVLSDTGKRAARPAGAGALAAELRVAIVRTSRRLRTEGATLDITAGQFSVLVALQAAPLTAGQLADREQIQAPSMTRIVNGLAAAGHVRRETNPADGRQVVVHLTESGAKAVHRVRSKRTQWLAQRVAKLSPAERATLHEAAAILTKMSAS